MRQFIFPGAIAITIFAWLVQCGALSSAQEGARNLVENGIYMLTREAEPVSGIRIETHTPSPKGLQGAEKSD